MGLESEYSYGRGRNRVLSRLRRKPLNQLAVLAIMLACARARMSGGLVSCPAICL